MNKRIIVERGVGKKSLAQSIFQVGGNGGSAIGPLLAAIIILPFGQHAISWFALAALLAAIIMVRLGVWYKVRLTYVVNHPQKQPLSPSLCLSSTSRGPLSLPSFLA